ncbi:G2/mitotic-specific cyclin-A-like isoform X2 [Haemaphysalis longicornis]
MTRRNASVNVGYADENSRPLNQPYKPTGNGEKAAGQAVHTRQALGCLQDNAVVDEKPLPRRDCAKQQAAAAVRRSAPLGASTDTDDSCDVAAAQPQTAGAPAGRPPSPLAPVCVAIPAAPKNVVPETPMSPDCGMECEGVGESPMVLGTPLHALEPMCYSDLRELESSVEYSQDIYGYLRDRELKFRPEANYMKKQPDIASSMRTILVDWLVEVAHEYKFHAETLFLAVSYVDSFLSSMSVVRNKLQLVGAASLLIAAKIEEIYTPEVKEFVYITDYAYTHGQVLRMEHRVLKTLSFHMAVPTINYFLLCFAQVNHAPDTAKHLGHYLCELALLDDVPYLQFLPSIVAGSALCLANHTLGRHPWGQELVEYSGYEVTAFRECVHSLYSSFCNAPSRPQRAVHDKFKTPKFHCVANLKPSPTLPC